MVIKSHRYNKDIVLIDKILGIIINHNNLQSMLILSILFLDSRSSRNNFKIWEKLYIKLFKALYLHCLDLICWAELLSLLINSLIIWIIKIENLIVVQKVIDNKVNIDNLQIISFHIIRIKIMMLKIYEIYDPLTYLYKNFLLYKKTCQ